MKVDHARAREARPGLVVAVGVEALGEAAVEVAEAHDHVLCGGAGARAQGLLEVDHGLHHHVQAREAHAVGGRRPRRQEAFAVDVKEVGKRAGKRRAHGQVLVAAEPEVVVHHIDPERAELVAGGCAPTPAAPPAAAAPATAAAAAAGVLHGLQKIERLRHLDNAKHVHARHGPRAVQRRHGFVDHEVHLEERQRLDVAVAEHAVVAEAVDGLGVPAGALALAHVPVVFARRGVCDIVVVHHVQKVEDFL